MTEFEVYDPFGQPVAFFTGGQLGALETHVRIDIAVEDDRLALREPLPDPGGGIGTVSREEQRHEVGVDLTHAAELAAQETGYQLAVDGRIETREVHILALDAPVGKKTAQHADLGRFTGPVQSFEYYEHRLIPDYLSFYPSISRPARYPRSIRTARSTPSASASASASVL